MHAVHRRGRRGLHGADARGRSTAAAGARRRRRPAAPPAAAASARSVAFAVAAGRASLLAAVHLTQGTSSVGARDLLAAAHRRRRRRRPPPCSSPPGCRGCWPASLVGVALGVAGAALQSLARNPLASPDTLAVNAGAYLAVVAVAAFGVVAAGAARRRRSRSSAGSPRPAWCSRSSAGGAAGPTRLVLAGSRSRSRSRRSPRAAAAVRAGDGRAVRLGQRLARAERPATAVAQIGAGRRWSASPAWCCWPAGSTSSPSATTPPRCSASTSARTRLAVVLLAVLLSAAAVTLAGPIGFVGLCAPVDRPAARGRACPGCSGTGCCCRCRRSPASSWCSAPTCCCAPCSARRPAWTCPTGVVTTLVGAVVLVWLARRYRDRARPGSRRRARPRLRGVRPFVVGRRSSAAVLVGASSPAMLLGDTWLLLGDVVNWVAGRTGPASPSCSTSAAAGARGAAGRRGARPRRHHRAGGVPQPARRARPPRHHRRRGVGAVARAHARARSPGSGRCRGRRVAARWSPSRSSTAWPARRRAQLRPAGAGRHRRLGRRATRVITFIIVLTDPWNTGKALTWLSGSTYGRTRRRSCRWRSRCVVLTPLLVRPAATRPARARRRHPRVLGRAAGAHPAACCSVGAALLTATAVSAVGVVGFVGLVAPHAARALVGGRHTRVLPVAALLGALLVSVADTLGRTVIAPGADPGRPGDRDDRHAVLRLAALALADVVCLGEDRLDRQPVRLGPSGRRSLVGHRDGLAVVEVRDLHRLRWGDIDIHDAVLIPETIKRRSLNRAV